MPQVDRVNESHRKRNIGAGVVVGVSVLVVAIVGFLVWKQIPSATTTANQVDALTAKGRYQDAYDQLQKAYGRATTTSDKALILSRLAATK